MADGPIAFSFSMTFPKSSVFTVALRRWPNGVVLIRSVVTWPSCSVFAVVRSKRTSSAGTVGRKKGAGAGALGGSRGLLRLRTVSMSRRFNHLKHSEIDEGRSQTMVMAVTSGTDLQVVNTNYLSKNYLSSQIGFYWNFG